MYMLASLGINIVVATFIGLGIGWVLDHKLFPRLFHWDSAPIFTLIFLLMGIVAGFRNIFKMTKEKGDAGNGGGEDGGTPPENQK